MLVLFRRPECAVHAADARLILASCWHVGRQTGADLCLLYSAVYGAIVMCMGGVLCITQPSFLGFAKSERSLLGVFFALFQVRCSVRLLLSLQQQQQQQQQQQP